MNALISGLKQDLPKSLHSDQPVLKYFHLGLISSGYNLPVLLVDIDKKGFKAAVNRICKVPEI